MQAFRGVDVVSIDAIFMKFDMFLTELSFFLGVFVASRLSVRKILRNLNS